MDGALGSSWHVSRVCFLLTLPCSGKDGFQCSRSWWLAWSRSCTLLKWTFCAAELLTLLQSDCTRLCFWVEIILPLAQLKKCASSFLFLHPELWVEVRSEPKMWSIFSLNTNMQEQIFYVVRSYTCMGENTILKIRESNKLYPVLRVAYFACFSTIWRLILVEDLDIDKLIWAHNKIPRI